MRIEKQIRIAIADDHPGYLNSLCRHLDSMGFAVVITAVNGKELVEQIENLAILPDVCIVDVEMVVLNGIDTSSKVRNAWPSVAIILMSMKTEEEIGDHVADRFIEKGTDLEVLHQTIEQLTKIKRRP